MTNSTALDASVHSTSLPATMRAAIIDAPGGPEALRLSEVPSPVRVNAEALVRVMAAGVNPVDAKTRAGRGVTAAVSSYPLILGNDFSGVVVEAPYAASVFQPGVEVFGMMSVPRTQGAYAEYVSVPVTQMARKPASLSHQEAAAVPLAALTAWGMVVEVTKAREGQRILIQGGAGGVGHFAVQLASYFGATVIATASEKNTGFLRSLGAKDVIDYTSRRFEDALDAPVDVVIDLVGNARDHTGSRSLATIRRGGLIVSALAGSWPTLAAEAAEAGVRATGFAVSPEGSTLSVLARLLDAGDISVTLDEQFPLAEAARAHERLESGHVRGKLVLNVASS